MGYLSYVKNILIKDPDRLDKASISSRTSVFNNDVIESFPYVPRQEQSNRYFYDHEGIEEDIEEDVYRDLVKVVDIIEVTKKQDRGYLPYDIIPRDNFKTPGKYYPGGKY